MCAPHHADMRCNFPNNPSRRNICDAEDEILQSHTSEKGRAKMLSLRRCTGSGLNTCTASWFKREAEQQNPTEYTS